MLLRCPNFIRGGVSPNLGNAQIETVFYVCAPLLSINFKDVRLFGHVCHISHHPGSEPCTPNCTHTELQRPSSHTHPDTSCHDHLLDGTMSVCGRYQPGHAAGWHGNPQPSISHFYPWSPEVEMWVFRWTFSSHPSPPSHLQLGALELQCLIGTGVQVPARVWGGGGGGGVMVL